MFKTVMNTLFANMKGKPFVVHYWDGEDRRYGSSEGDIAFTLFFHRQPSVPTENPLLWLGESYMDGVFDIQGDWDALLGMISRNLDNLLPPMVTKTLQRVGSAVGKLTSWRKKNISHHYDIGNDFYRLWLDETMSYSCAFFHSKTDSLEQAQRNKIALCLDKLGVEPGMRLLDIGCGWGQMALAAAERGATVVGVTLSEEQAAEGRRRAKDAGFGDKIDIRLQDYLTLDDAPFDRIVSVGMFEHISREDYKAYFDCATKHLKDGGLMLLHTITSLWYSPTNPWIDKYIFPGGEIPPVSAVIEQLAGHNLYPVHIESLRMHYARTLDMWLDRFLAAREDVLKMFDERFIRMWTMYLHGCASSFRTSNLDIHQFLLSKDLNNHLPLGWGHLYPHKKSVEFW